MKIASIKWNQLEHAYGVADDIPKYLLELKSNDKTKQENAQEALVNRINHQQELFSATSATIPFLVEMLIDDTIENKSIIYGILVGIAGSSTRTLQKPDIIAKSWEISYSEAVKIHKNDKRYMKQTRQKLIDGFDIFISNLSSSDREIRILCIHILLNLHFKFDQVASEYRKRLDVERDDTVKQELLEAINSLQEIL